MHLYKALLIRFEKNTGLIWSTTMKHRGKKTHTTTRTTILKKILRHYIDDIPDIKFGIVASKSQFSSEFFLTGEEVRINKGISASRIELWHSCDSLRTSCKTSTLYKQEKNVNIFKKFGKLVFEIFLQSFENFTYKISVRENEYLAYIGVFGQIKLLAELSSGFKKKFCFLTVFLCQDLCHIGNGVCASPS